MYPTSAAQRVAVNTSNWSPTPQQWECLLASLPEAERASLLRFVHFDDRKRALVSRLLQRACVVAALGEDWQRVAIARTKGNKPFYVGTRERPHAPNFNYNVSHEGDFVVLASESHCLCGVDVAAPNQLRRKGTAKPLIQVLTLMKEQQLTATEWSLIESLSGDEAAMEAAFQAIWSCKEAFIKARGDGVGFAPLSRLQVQLPASFTQQQQQQQCHPAVQAVQLAVDGLPQPRWRAFLQRLPHSHWVAVVRGPPDAAVDDQGVFRATMQLPVIPEADFQALLDAPSPAFDLLSVEDLLPADLQDAYEALE